MEAARIKVDNDASQAIVITEYYSSNKNETCKFQIEDITFESIKATINGTHQVGEIACQPSKPCKSITLKDVKISGGKQSWQCNEAQVSASSVEPSISCTH